MGNTILSHILYATKNVDLDVNDFFSTSGHAHKISRLIPSVNLTKNHQHEQPLAHAKCLIEIKTDGWYEVLRFKLSYEKWMKQYPTVDNFQIFFDLKMRDDRDQLWRDFYQVFKDPNWLQCDRYEDRKLLPLRIQEEIDRSFQLPKNKVDRSNFIELLSLTYADYFRKQTNDSMFGGAIYMLSDYLKNDLTVVKDTIKHTFGWSWDDKLSDKFYQTVIEVNKKYLDWLENMKKMYCNDAYDANILDWEKALLIGFKTFNQEKNYGKTI